MAEGKHVKIQAYGVEFDKLNSIDFVETFLVDLVLAAGMRVLGEPHVYDILKEIVAMGEEPCSDEPEGVTGIVVLSTSHVAGHTWPRRGYIVIDLFSCRDFSNHVVDRAIEESLEPTRYKVDDLSFSLKFPGKEGGESET